MDEVLVCDNCMKSIEKYVLEVLMVMKQRWIKTRCVNLSNESYCVVLS